MITSKKFNIILAAVLTLAILFTSGFMFIPELFGIEAAAANPDYGKYLFGTEAIVSLDIVADETEWQNMLDNAASEEYISCDLVINGQKFKSVGIRPKGNSSLSTIANNDDTDRYSFKFKIDEYVSGQTCYGLDKFVINNIYSDTTYMKEYLSYQLMDYMGVPSSLCSYANVTLNGEGFGCYLLVESIEESYALRNFGSDYGSLYKPESMGVRGNGQMNDFIDRNTATDNNESEDISGKASGDTSPSSRQANPGTGRPGGRQRPGDAGGNGQNAAGGTTPPADTDDPTDTGDKDTVNGEGINEGINRGMNGSGGGTDLVYTDSQSSSYSSIFNNAVFSSTNEADYQRVITALKNLGTGTDLETYIDVDEVLRYFAVNTAIVNLDSYVSNMTHNYYLYEHNGKISMLPWDFNLSFAGFGAGTALSAVNFPLDTPVSRVDLSERPILSKLLEVEEYKERYHRYLSQIVTGYFESGLFESTIDTLNGIINSAVKDDATAFYTYDEYTAGIAMLKEFGALRAKSIKGQLEGIVPSTTIDQNANPNLLIDASSIDLSIMGMQGGDRQDGKMGRIGGFPRDTEGGVIGGDAVSGAADVPPILPDGNQNNENLRIPPGSAGNERGNLDTAFPQFNAKQDRSPNNLDDTVTLQTESSVISSRNGATLLISAVCLIAGLVFSIFFNVRRKI